MQPVDIKNNPLLNPPKEPAPMVAKVIDISSWALPTIAAILATIGGVGALYDANTLAAIFGIVSGVISALGVVATGWSSKIRDGRLVITHAVASLSMDMADRALTSHSVGIFY